MEELLGSEGICAVSIRNEPKVFRKFFEMPKCHPHCKDARTHTAIIRYLITDNGAFGGIHNKPDAGFDATDFDVCFIGSKYLAGSVIVIIYERLYADRGSFTVVGNLLVRDTDAVDVFQSLGCFPEG